MKTFEYWEYEQLELTFNLKRSNNNSILKTWLSAKCAIPVYEKQALTRLKNRLSEKVDSWNEDELKFFFISQIIGMIDFITEKYSTFTQRPLSATKLDVNGNAVELKGRVEFVVSAGKQHPRHPYFCLHEYKPEKRRDPDPLGQLLAAMLAAQANNKATHPLYGCYVIGRMWFFVLLDGDTYSVSRSYDATHEDDLTDIYCILQECKNYIDLLVG
jgi:hypothetical protein